MPRRARDRLATKANNAIFVGCAGWSVARAHAAQFPDAGSHLERYAARMNCTEINSSFYRPHRAETYARWAASVPHDFRFAVKMPRSITHDARLHGVAKELDAFLAQAGGLGAKLGCLLIQLPPSFAFAPAPIGRFLKLLRRRHDGDVVLEARHVSWFDGKADALLREYALGRVAADPALVASAAVPGGDPRCAYFRLHGAPRMYYSAYSDASLRALARRLRASLEPAGRCWCIFDNTALGAALPNALQVRKLLQKV